MGGLTDTLLVQLRTSAPVETLVGADGLIFFEVIRSLIRIVDSHSYAIDTVATVNGFENALVDAARRKGGVAPFETRSRLNGSEFLFQEPRIEIDYIHTDTVIRRRSNG